MKNAVWFISSIIAKVFGIPDIRNAEKYARIAIGLGVVLVIVFIVVIAFRACKSESKIDLETVDKINSKNEVTRKEELKVIIEKNADVVRTVDNRTAIAETNALDRDRQIEAKVKEADAKIQEAKNQKGDVTAEELECILTGVCK